jgi:hypothetical protein
MDEKLRLFQRSEVLHLRRFFGESDIKYPSRVGIALSRADFEHLLSIQNELLAEFDRIQLANNARNTSTVPDTTIIPDTQVINYDEDTVPHEDANPFSRALPTIKLTDPRRLTLKRKNLIHLV